MKAPVCPDCAVDMVQRTSMYGVFWSCPRYPECQNTIGAHQSTGEPLGVPASKEGRAWRIKAHASFDALWDCKDGISRSEAYLWLTKKMKLGEQAHIGNMDIGQCRKVVGLCSICPPKKPKQNKEK